MIMLNDRIRKLRKALDLTQQEFADRLGVKRNTVATYEIGRSQPIDAVISLICREFDVSESWLRTGEGEMFIQRARDEELTALVNDLLAGEGSDFRHRIITALLRLTPEQWAVMETVAQNLLDECTPVPVSVSEPPAVPGWKPMTDAEIEAELEDYRRELLAEREAGARLSVSPKRNGA